MNPSQFLTLLGRTNPGKVYLFAGPEIYWQERGRQAILNQYLPEDARDFNFLKCDDSPEQVRQGLHFAQSAPFGADFRLIVFRGPRLSRTDMVQMLETFLKASSTRSILIIETEKVNKGSRLEKLAEEFGFFIDCSSPGPAEKKQWIQNYAKEQGFIMDVTASSVAADRVGNTLLEASFRLNLLFDWMPAPGRISAKMVEEVLSIRHEPPLWEISNALSDKNGKKALATIHDLLIQGEAPLVLLTVIIRLIRNWIYAKEMLQKNGSEAEIVAALKIPPFKSSSFLRLVRSLPPKLLHRLYLLALKTDDRVKSTSLPPKILLEELILTMVSGLHKSGES